MILTIKSGDGTALGEATVQTITDGDIIAELRLFQETPTHGDVFLLRELELATDDLALAVMDHIEQELAARGLCIETAEDVLRLGRDFSGMVITEGGHRIAFRLMYPRA